MSNPTFTIVDGSTKHRVNPALVETISIYNDTVTIIMNSGLTISIRTDDPQQAEAVYIGTIATWDEALHEYHKKRKNRK